MKSQELVSYASAFFCGGPTVGRVRVLSGLGDLHLLSFPRFLHSFSHQSLWVMGIIGMQKLRAAGDANEIGQLKFKSQQIEEKKTTVV